MRPAINFTLRRWTCNKGLPRARPGSVLSAACHGLLARAGPGTQNFPLSSQIARKDPNLQFL